METIKSKKKNINKNSVVSKAKLTDIIRNPKYTENYIGHTIQANEKNFKVVQDNKDIESKKKNHDNEIDFQLKNLIEHLYSIKFKLEKEKKKEKEKEKEKEKKVTPLSNRKCLLKEKENGTNGQKKSVNIKSNTLEQKCKEGDKLAETAIPNLIKTIEIYKNRVIEEERRKRLLVQKYEKMLRSVKKKHMQEINEIKNNILMDVDFIIQKYRNISMELLEISKEKEKEKVDEKKKISEICIMACKRFEEDVKKKAMESIREHESEMLSSLYAIKREKEDIEKKYIELKNKKEKSSCNEKRQAYLFEQQMKKKQVLSEDHTNNIPLEKDQRNHIIKSIYTKVDSQIKTYEENIVKVFHDILVKNNISLGIDELSQQIKDIMIKQCGS
ncbi:conserved protein, unknown function [Hepatocystis sp. ex Piliocolobus tephrosceles]|nr:conserved protein, unknown function [Hepatocystis sp. ex Piliocolobus tephrosceles]